MSTVVAVVAEDGAWMAADSLTNIYDRPITGARKILVLPVPNGHVLIGLAGTAASDRQIRSAWPAVQDPPPADDEGRQGWADATAAIITEAMVAAGLVDDGKMDGSFLLAMPGALFTITHHMAIRSPDGRGAVGSGEGPAMGALDALLDAAHAHPRYAVEQAARIAVGRDRWSGLPLTVESVEL